MGKVRENYWFIGIKRREIGYDPAEEERGPFEKEGFQEIKSPDGTYWADPFIFHNWLFFENYNYDKGHISVARILPDLTLDTVHDCLDMPYHLSFPNVFEADDKRYMVPESGRSGGIQLFRSAKFPYQWQWIKTIYTGVCSDVTVYKVNGWWYLFTTEDGDNKLLILRSAHIEGEWEKIYHGEHMDSRPAGNLFLHDGQLIRPVQEGTPNYGHAVLFKAVHLTPNYTEKVIDRLDPEWYPGLIGCHTYNRNELYTVVDGKIKL